MTAGVFFISRMLAAWSRSPSCSETATSHGRPWCLPFSIAKSPAAKNAR